MRFPAANQLHFGCRFADLLPGRLHSDGRRYLPTLILAWPTHAQQPLHLALVDRHHRVDLDLIGQQGHAQLIFALGELTRFVGTKPSEGLHPEAGWEQRGFSSNPTVIATIEELLDWEQDPTPLSNPMIYAEMLLRFGDARVGLRTSLSATDFPAPLRTGEIIVLRNARLDILGFRVEPVSATRREGEQ